MAIEVYPVVHVVNEMQARSESEVALSTGADGVYLISHKGLSTHELLRFVDLVKRDNPGEFVGINALGSTPQETFQTIMDRYNEAPGRIPPDGVWVDDADIAPEETLEFRKSHSLVEPIKYLGGVAFKYSRHHTSSPEQAADEAARLAPFVDVVTTTGPATGRPPSTGKIAAMKHRVPDKPLAIASGINEFNIVQFEGLADQVLVATSIKDPQEQNIDTRRLGYLVEIAHSLGSSK